MKQIALFIIFVVVLVASSCSTSRKTATTNTQAEAQLTATAEQQNHAEATEQAAVITNVTTDERRNVVIDFAKVEFYPGSVPSIPSDSTAHDILNAVCAAATEEGQKAKPPNVKSVTKGRAIINGEKNEQARTEAQAERTETEDTTTAQDVKADSKGTTDCKTEEKPKFTFWDWLYLAIVGGFSIYAIIIGVSIARKLHKNAKNQ